MPSFIYARPLFATLAAVMISASLAKVDVAMSNTSLWLSSSVYCDPNTYISRIYNGYSRGFVPTHHISVPDDTTEGVVGYMTTQRLIYVAFRGSETLENWKDDLNVLFEEYDACTACQVHAGFYSAQQAAFPQVLAAVKSLRTKFPRFNTVVTGHSLGAALATLTALDLTKVKVGGTVNLVHFGSPRVGNDAFAYWASGKLTATKHRFTHHRDIAVHYPRHERFMHIDGEVYEEEQWDLKECTGTEDVDCSFKWSLTSLSVSDHLMYLGKTLGVAGCE